MFKWLSMKKVTLATHNWTKGESEILSAIVRERIEKNMAYQG
jgi:FixJ family two-component response regulator